MRSFFACVFYLYLPLRASQTPTLNYGDPSTLNNFITHIFGKHLHERVFSSSNAFIDNLTKFFNIFFLDLSNNKISLGDFNLAIALILLGIFTGFAHFKKFSGFLSFNIITTLAITLDYNIFDIESYFLLISVCFSFFAIMGILSLAIFLHQNKVKQIFLILILSLFVILEVFQNFNKVDRSKTYIFEDYTKALLNSVEPNAIIFTYQWDLTSSAYYFQNVKNFRKDVAIISTGFFFQT